LTPEATLSPRTVAKEAKATSITVKRSKKEARVAKARKTSQRSRSRKRTRRTSRKSTKATIMLRRQQIRLVSNMRWCSTYFTFEPGFSFLLLHPVDQLERPPVPIPSKSRKSMLKRYSLESYSRVMDTDSVQLPNFSLVQPLS
jgi:hypothetical protein